MADKSFGLKQVNLIGASGTPRIESPNNLNINATNVAISTNMSVGGELTVTDTFLKPHAVGLGTTNAAGRDAGISTATGTVIYDSEVGMQVYSGAETGWRTVANTASVTRLTATGGDTTFTSGNYKVHKFSTTGSSTFTVSNGDDTVEVFLVGGGGSGSTDSGGGGGGGACVYGTSVPITPGTYPVSVASGGSQPSTYYSDPEANWASNYGGGTSTINHPGGAINAYGGNAGGTSYGPGSNYVPSPISDGSHGNLGSTGGAHTSSPVPTSTSVSNAGLTTPYPTPATGTYSVFRNAGGNVNAPRSATWAGAGGGGAGGAGGNTTNAAGVGGPGYNAAGNIPWMPSSEGASGLFGGGGGAGSPDNGTNGGGAGGPGGGGAGGGEGSSSGTAGSPNTGGGGGGVDGSGGSAGGSGVVYIAYLTN